MVGLGSVDHLVPLAVSLLCSAGTTSGNSGAILANWAIIVDTSRFWYNYRHGANALTVYHNVKVSFYPIPLLWQGASSSF